MPSYADVINDIYSRSNRVMEFGTAGQGAQKLFLDPSTGLHGMNEIDSSVFKPSHTSAYFKVKDAD